MDVDFVLPIGKAKVMKEGTDISLISHSKQVGFCMEAAKILAEKGINAEVVNLRTVRPLDRDTVLSSVKKTGRLVTVEEGYPQSGVGSELACLCVESEVFDYLDAPIARITAADIPLPYAAHLEAVCIPQVDDIVRVAERVCARPGP
jgi:pyruvate dehydrogenase E1 component beta subunit